MPTEAAITRDDIPGDYVEETYRLGDSWTSDTYAILVNGAPVDLTGWRVFAQVRVGGAVVAEWSTSSNTVTITQATLDDGRETSAIALRHSPAESRQRGPFGPSPFECEVSRYASAATPDTEDPEENYTVLYGRLTALADVSHR